MSNNINGVTYDGDVNLTIPAGAGASDIDRIVQQAQRDAQRGGQSITVTGNGHNVSRNGGTAGNGKRG